jgi:two-component system chemotaxis sensor kinase CheA
MTDFAVELEQLASDLVLMNTGDWQELFSYQERLGNLASACEPAQAAIVRLAGGVIEAIIHEQAPSTNDALKLLGDIIAVLQRHFRDGVPVDELKPPIIPDWVVRLDDGEPSEAPAGTRVLDDDDLARDFATQAKAELAELEWNLLAVSDGPVNPQLYDGLRRSIHTIRGEAGTLGMDDLNRVAWAMEEALDIDMGRQRAEAMMQAKDWLDLALSKALGEVVDLSSPEAVILALEASPADTDAMPAGPSPEPSDSHIPTSDVEQRQDTALARKPGTERASSLKADPEMLAEFVGEAMDHLEQAEVHLLTLETNPGDDEAINAIFRAFHTLKGLSGLMELDEIQSLAHHTEDVLDQARKGALTLGSRSIDLIFEAVDGLKRLIESVRIAVESSSPDMHISIDLDHLIRRLDTIIAHGGDNTATDMVTAVSGSGDDEGAPDTSQPLGEILVGQGLVSKDALSEALAEQQHSTDEHGTKRHLGQVLVEKKHVTARQVASALRQQREVAQRGAKVKETVKVDAGRLDRLVDAIGELVIAETMVSEADEIQHVESAEFGKRLSLLGKITRELQEIATSLRMVPVKATFQRMTRLARDVAGKTGKQVDFAMSGEDTELDKTVVDRVGDPLVHMVRNAIDHGLEAGVDDRRAAGKADAGRVELLAFHQSGNICIQVRDDGKGLDRDAILAKAVCRGLVKEGDDLSDGEVFKLIFEPGFSTKEQVSDLSGRGVGMDVVRRNIEAMRGRIEIDSVHGRGSTFTIRLPLTLAIIDGMVVRVGGERYIVPTLAITMSLRPSQRQLSTVMGRGEMLRLHGDLIPVFRLHDLFSVEGAMHDPARALIIVVEAAGKRAGLMVDELLGQQQIVIKSLGDSFSGLDGISGGAIMSDGSIGLILDASAIIRLAQENTVGAIDD